MILHLEEKLLLRIHIHPSMHLDQNGKLNVALLPVQRQSEGNNCGLFAIAFAADIMYGLSPMESFYDTAQMRNHLISC